MPHPAWVSNFPPSKPSSNYSKRIRRGREGKTRMTMNLGKMKHKTQPKFWGGRVLLREGDSNKLRSVMARATRNAKKKLRRKMKKSTTTSNPLTSSSLGAQSTTTSNPLSSSSLDARSTTTPSPVSSSSLSSQFSPAGTGLNPGSSWKDAEASMLREPPGLALMDYSSIEIAAATENTTMITSTAATANDACPVDRRRARRM